MYEPIQVGHVDADEAQAAWTEAIDASEGDKASGQRGGKRKGAGAKPLGEHAKVQLSTRIDTSSVDQLRELAAAYGMPQASVLELAIQAAHDEWKESRGVGS